MSLQTDHQHRGEPKANGIWMAAGLLFVLSVLAIRVHGMLTRQPVSFVDEVIYIEPAVQAAATGTPSAPGIAKQLSQKGVAALDRAYHLTTPLNWAVRVPFFLMISDPLIAKAAADLGMLVLFCVSFLFAARCMGGWEAALWCLGSAVMNRFAGFTAAGRPDLLAASLGLAALALIIKAEQNKPLFFGAGALAGLAVLAHQFGGALWGLVCAGLLAISSGRKGLASAAQAAVLFAAGGALIGFIYLCWLLPEFELWKSHFLWLVNLKKHLSVNPVLSLREIFHNSVLRMPVIWLLVCFGMARIGGNAQRSLFFCLLGGIAVGVAWKTLGFEHYNYQYNAHFAAMACLSVASAWESVSRTLASLGSVRVVALLLSLASAGWACVSNAHTIATFLFLPNSMAFEARQRALDRIPEGARVLAACPLYFEVRRGSRTLMAHHENLDIGFFDYIIYPNREIPSFKNRDQWFDALTEEQHKKFMSRFELLDAVPAVELSFRVPAVRVQPSTLGLYIFKKRCQKNDNDKGVWQVTNPDSE